MRCKRSFLTQKSSTCKGLNLEFVWGIWALRERPWIWPGRKESGGRGKVESDWGSLDNRQNSLDLMYKLFIHFFFTDRLLSFFSVPGPLQAGAQSERDRQDPRPRGAEFKNKGPDLGFYSYQVSANSIRRRKMKTTFFIKENLIFSMAKYYIW